MCVCVAVSARVCETDREEPHSPIVTLNHPARSRVYLCERQRDRGREKGIETGEKRCVYV